MKPEDQKENISVDALENGHDVAKFYFLLMLIADSESSSKAQPEWLLRGTLN